MEQSNNVVTFPINTSQSNLARESDAGLEINELLKALRIEIGKLDVISEMVPDLSSDIIQNAITGRTDALKIILFAFQMLKAKGNL